MTVRPLTPVFKPDWLDWPETRTLVAAFASQPDSIRFVGGAVRDGLLKRRVQDIDVATSLLPEDVLSHLQQAHIKAIPTGLAHGTVTAVIGERHFEITTLRKDVACDGRHAQIAYTDNWKEDAARRDFTMNALYLSPEGRLYDYFDGAQDATTGSIKFIGDAAERIAEDRLRILRFFRFYAHYGIAAPDPVALQACRQAAAQLGQLSGERIQQELVKLLAAQAAAETLELMHKNEVLSSALGFAVPDLGPFGRLPHIESLTRHTMSPYMRMALFFRRAAIAEHKAFEQLADRLKLSNAIRHDLKQLVTHHAEVTPLLNRHEQKVRIRALGKQVYGQIIMINWACDDMPMVADCPYYVMLEFANEWQIPVFPITGQDLLDIGQKPGKAMGDLLRELEQFWEDQDYQPNRAELINKARQP